MIVSTLIAIARSRLGDEDEHRWTNDRLRTILDQGQKDFCKESGIFRKITVVPLGNNITKYSLPNDTMTINRIEYKGDPIPLFSRNDIDSARISRQEFVGIKDNLNMSSIELYPFIPEITTIEDVRDGLVTSDSFDFNSLFGVVTDIGDPYELDSDFGVIVGSNYDILELEPSTQLGEVCDTSDIIPVYDDIDVYGVAVAIEPNNSTHVQKGFITSSEKYEVIGKYGITTSIVSEDGYIRIFYTAIPEFLYSDRQELNLHDMWETAMVRYMVGTALQDDNDANNIQRGELELSKYATEVAKAKDLTSKDFSRGQKDKLITRFRRV